MTVVVCADCRTTTTTPTSIFPSIGHSGIIAAGSWHEGRKSDVLYTNQAKGRLCLFGFWVAKRKTEWGWGGREAKVAGVLSRFLVKRCRVSQICVGAFT